MSTLYHYCSVETLKAILKNESLRLSDVTKSNDSKEVSYFFEKYIEWISKNNNGVQMNLDALKYEAKNQLENTLVLASCFSKQEDNLHMWCEYGKHGKGVSIWFNEDKLKKCIDLIRMGVREEFFSIRTDARALKLVKVNYFNDESLDDYFSKKMEKNWKDFSTIFWDSPCVKNSYFGIEDEVRIIYVKIFNPLEEDINYVLRTDENGYFIEKIDISNVQDDQYGDKDVLDIKISLDTIESIMLGSNCEEDEREIKKLIPKNCSSKIAIKKSKGSLR